MITATSRIISGNTNNELKRALREQRSLFFNGREASIKVGFISYDFYPPEGGQGVFAHQIYNALAKIDGVEMSVMSSRKNDIEDHELIKVTERYGFGPLHFSYKANLFLKRFIKKKQIDILQINGGPGGVFLYRKPRVPVVYIAHHTYAQQYRHLGKQFVHKILKTFEGRGYRLSHRIIAVSTTTAASLINDYGIKKEIVEVIPDGVNTELFRRQKGQKEPGSILFVGRLCDRKGLPFLIDAIGTIHNKLPTVKLYIVGEGPLRDLLEARVGELGISDNVTFIGKVTEQELVDWYNRMEVLVLPSLFEGFGMVCLEAMACGTPVIATDSPGIVDVVKNEWPCALVPPGDSEKLASALIEYFRDGRNRFARDDFGVDKRFLWPQIAERYKAVYDDILSRVSA